MTRHDLSLPPRRSVVHGGLGAAALGLLVPACSGPGDGTPAGPTTSSTPVTSSAPGPVRKPLVVFFSRAGENYHDGGRKVLTVGNTAVLAGHIAELADVDLHEIRAADPYPDDYDATVRRNSEEQEADARPAIEGALPDVSGYDTVLLGSGVWNVRAPMIMRTFVEAVDLRGKTVLPFVTFAVSGIGRVADDYARLLPGSTLGEPLAVRGEEAAGAAGEVRAWLRRTGHSR